MSELEGKVAIVTGGARGIGGATVEALCAEGAYVFVADVLDEGEAFAKRLASEGKCARFVKLDVTDESQWKEVVEDIVREFGHLDILVNNAGIGTFEDVEQETRAGWDKVIAVNQMGVWLGMKYAIPAM
ncbi:MAG TPA: SDR family NAD(P)-dependent oxidoreductase, partial [Candidatus Limnocylindria bacterium]|nr:SDR family NAD(P)-dependent oxidoreductase [Candidatus Limnocylindria bacterium]